MRSRDIIETLEALIDQKLPTFLWGAPGIGKSSVVRQIAEAKGIGFIDLRLSLMDPTDLKGIPFYENQAHQAVWAPPSFLPRPSGAERDRRLLLHVGDVGRLDEARLVVIDQNLRLGQHTPVVLRPNGREKGLDMPVAIERGEGSAGCFHELSDRVRL